MEFRNTGIEGLYLVIPKLIEDERGLFTRTYCETEFEKILFKKKFVQFNHSFNTKSGTIRGLHFQIYPFQETKLIRCVKGAVWDIAVDIRKNSPTYLKHVAFELTEKNMHSVLIPEGFAHGFQTLENDTSLIYHHTNFFSQQADSGLLYNDPSLNIKWPKPVNNISPKDLSYKRISDNLIF